MKSYCTCREPDLLCGFCLAKEHHEDDMENRSMNVARILVRRGKPFNRAIKIADRFIGMEFKREINWD